MLTGMEIYIFRHGIAESGQPGQPDSERRLTAEGKQKLRAILACARKAGVRPDVVLSSPYARAKETAELARQELRLETAVIQKEALKPLEPPEGVWEEVRLYKDAGQLLLSGHEPQLSSFVGYLMGGGRVDLKKGAIARVDVEGLGPHPAGALVWLLTAKLAGG
jgi:phosphohistidine phosphatase